MGEAGNNHALNNAIELEHVSSQPEVVTLENDAAENWVGDRRAVLLPNNVLQSVEDVRRTLLDHITGICKPEGGPGLPVIDRGPTFILRPGSEPTDAVEWFRRNPGLLSFAAPPSMDVDGYKFQRNFDQTQSILFEVTLIWVDLIAMGCFDIFAAQKC